MFKNVFATCKRNKNTIKYGAKTKGLGELMNYV